MFKNSIATGYVHIVPKDLKEEIVKSTNILEKWNSLTPLARNEWICWIISVKKDKTRKEHISRMIEELKKGKRRPCCWIGCIHR